MKAIITGEDVGTTIDFRTIGPYEAQYPWPCETVVSAGGGIVLIRNAKPGEAQSYTTLFMEVYPPGAAFIRGEGETPEACETAAWDKYQLAMNCTDGSGTHDWESRGYKNGAGFCVRCNSFGSKVFTGEQLGQLCAECGVGTTHHWVTAEDESILFLCADHYVRTERLTMRELFAALMGEPKVATTSTEDVESCPTDAKASRDVDGFCTTHGWDCADYAMSLRTESEPPTHKTTPEEKS